MYYTIFWTYVSRSGNETKGDTTLWAKTEEEAEERFFLTHEELKPMSTSGYDIRRIMSEKE